MPEWLTYLLVFISGLLFNYIFRMLDLFMNYLVNNQALRTSDIQKQIDINSTGEVCGQSPCIGFHVNSNEEEIQSDDEDE